MHGVEENREVLVLLDEDVRWNEVADELSERLRGDPAHVTVLAPALRSQRTSHGMGELSEAVRSVAERLRLPMARLRAEGHQVAAEIGDRDPVVAIGQQLRENDATEIIFIGGRRKAWSRVSECFSRPVSSLSASA